MKRIMLRLCPLALSAVAVAACNTRPITIPSEAPAQVTPNTFNQSLNNKADILFMIDNSNSMEPKQTSLKQYFPNFMQPLAGLPVKPDLHIGVVTSDLGAGQYTPPSCNTIGGSQGILQNAANGTTCTTAHLNNAADRFLIYRPNSTGGVETNFTGDVADAFTCYASVGINGCGFEHQLATVRAALEGCESDAGCKQHQNANFFRKDAYLAVIYLTDEDDCSGPTNSQLFDPTQTSLNSVLGPLTSYRCFEFGNLCGGVDPGRQQGPRQDCQPGNKDTNPLHQLTPVEDFASQLKGLKPQDPRMVYVSVIAAPPSPVAIGLDAQGYPDLQPSCTGAIGSGDPGIRLTKFVAQFDSDRGSFISICAQDLKAAMEKIANELAQILGRQCLSAPLKDKDTATDGLQPDCVVEDRTTIDATAGTYDYRRIPACQEMICTPASAPSGDCKCQRHAEATADAPCWYVWNDLAACPMIDTTKPISEQPKVGSGYQVMIDRGTDAACINPPPASGTYAVVQCSSCIADPSKSSYDCSPGCAQYWPNCCPGDGSTPAANCYQ
ncbi:MAG TPA: hypothetical protein VGQ83_27405 [Polyangia bacterium]|jgi:hypothetical protein